ncbi:MAG: hypothetical protein H7Y88_04130 [Phycisphaerales bacterium]|nr:hypothetical protein [Phycisphaerales bacterium]
MQESIAQAELAREQAHEIFNRVMRAWVVDLLSIRRQGLDRPGARGLREPGRQPLRLGRLAQR